MADDKDKKLPTYEEIKDKGNFSEDESDIIAAKAREELKASANQNK